MKYILLFSVFLLTGCSTLFGVTKFPESNSELMKSCQNLEIIETPEITLSELTKIVVRNYQKYHECATIVDGWQEWYKNQKKIFEEATE